MMIKAIINNNIRIITIIIIVDIIHIIIIIISIVTIITIIFVIINIIFISTNINLITKPISLLQYHIIYYIFDIIRMEEVDWLDAWGRDRRKKGGEAVDLFDF